MHKNTVASGPFHGKVDMTLKFQVHQIAKKLFIMIYTHVEVTETKRITSIDQIFSEIQQQTWERFLVNKKNSSKLLKFTYLTKRIF